MMELDLRCLLSEVNLLIYYEYEVLREVTDFVTYWIFRMKGHVPLVH
jgi:hypothetical protein